MQYDSAKFPRTRAPMQPLDTPQEGDKQSWYTPIFLGVLTAATVGTFLVLLAGGFIFG